MKKEYNLSVEDFGPVKKANIDISPLTIFVGKNSSGKSFLSQLIHTLSNPFNHNMHRFPSHSLNYLIQHNKVLFNEFEKKLKEYIETNPSFQDDAFEYPLDKFTELINEGFGKCYIKLIEDKLKSNWKTTLNNLNRRKKDSFRINYNNITFTNKSNKLTSDDIINEINKSIKRINFIYPIGIKISTEKDFLKINLDYQLLMKIYDKDENTSFAQIIYVLIINELINQLKNNSFYIPAYGEIFNDFNGFMSNELFGTTEISNIQKEFINNLLNVNNGTQKGYFYNLACELEEEIFNGEIQIRNGELKDELIFVDNKNNLEFELTLVSSSVNELIPLIIYLKYYLNKGDTLIIEEIENHLHPENQLILVKYLVKAINYGLNIILTTHSDYIVEKFNNLIRLGNCDKEVFNELNYDETCILNHNDVSIYNFKKNDDYSYTPQNIDINFTGFSDDNFTEVIDELYAESDIMDKYKLR